MELNFSELDNMNTKNPYENFDYNAYENQTGTNPEKYWEQQNIQKQQQTKKKKVSFDDILSNMNLVVNKSGVLQFMTPNQPIEQQYGQQQYDQQEIQVKIQRRLVKQDPCLYKPESFYRQR
jgi:hypothetical protein